MSCPAQHQESNAKMKKKFLLASVIVLLLVVAGAFMWNSMNQPLYEPGMVRAAKDLSAPLDPPPQSGAAESWIVEDGITLYHFSHGAGRRVLIVHGGPGYPYTQPWIGLEPLTNSYEFIYYDQRGCGQSTRPIDRFESQNYYENLTRLDRALGLGAQIADIERIRRILGEEKLILVGHSFGGFIASLYAAEFPEHVEALILVAPAEVLVMPMETGGLFAEVRERLPEEMLADFDGWQKRYLDYGSIFSKSEAELAALSDEFARYYSVANPGPVAQPGKAGGWMAHAMYFSMGLRHDYRPALKSVTAPVLVLHGADDLQPEAASRMYADTFPNARFEVIEDATHFPFDEQPQLFAQIVGDFLRALPSP